MATKSQNAVAYDAVRGAKMEVGTFTIDVGSIPESSEVETTTEFKGVSSGDTILVNGRNLETRIVLKSARTSDTDEVSLLFGNFGDTSVDPAEATIDYVVFSTGNIDQ